MLVDSVDQQSTIASASKIVACVSYVRIFYREDVETSQGLFSASAANLQNVECHGFGDLPPHVLETLMYHVLRLGSVDTVRSCRLVCKAWRSAGATCFSVSCIFDLDRPCTL